MYAFQLDYRRKLPNQNSCMQKRQWKQQQGREFRNLLLTNDLGLCLYFRQEGFLKYLGKINIHGHGSLIKPFWDT